MNYRYPTHERTTDFLESRQDSHKRSREIAMIQAMMAFHWRNAMDFGCGLGRNFALFAQAGARREGARLLAIEADLARLEEARKHGDGYASADLAITYGTSLDQIASRRKRMDLILCCQVITHMPVDAAQDALAAFASLLRKGGVLVICVPFHVGLARADFFHAVSFRGASAANVVRTPISRRRFDDLAAHPRQGLLPVRAFATRFSTAIRSNADLPCSVVVPTPFARLSGFRCTGCFAYSVHQFRTGAPLIGDLILKLVRD